MHGVVDLRDVAGKFLPQRQRRGVHQVGPADLDDVLESFPFLIQRLAQALDGGNEAFVDPFHCRDVHGSGEGVIGRLAPVDVVVRVHWVLASHLAAGNFNGAVGDDLVGVHVGLGAGAGLPDHQREVVIQLAIGATSSAAWQIRSHLCLSASSPS